MSRTLKFAALISFAALSFVISAKAQLTMSGEVVDVIDGKTVLVALPSGTVKVELQYIDVPEQGQELTETVKEHLRNLVAGKSVEYRLKALLRNRAIGQLTIKNVDVSRQMLRDGAAWHLPIESSGQDKAEFDLYASTESAARNEKVGVWSVEGLRPSWEVRAENKQRATQQELYIQAETSYARATGKRCSRVPSGGNPALGDIGALVNRYDPETRTGYVGTSFLDVREVDQTEAARHRTSVDISYFYKQDHQNRRKGVFVISVISRAKKWRFATNNNLTFIGDGRNVSIGKPRRSTSTERDHLLERLTYQVSRPAMEKIVNNDQVLLKLGTYIMHPTDGFKYLLYNLLQVSK